MTAGSRRVRLVAAVVNRIFGNVCIILKAQTKDIRNYSSLHPHDQSVDRDKELEIDLAKKIRIKLALK